MNKTRNVLITGGLGGIGFSICEYFILKNFNLIILDNLPLKKFNEILSNSSIKKSKSKILCKFSLFNSNKKNI